METAAVIKSLISLILVLATITGIWLIIKKFGYKFQKLGLTKIPHKISTTMLDNTNKIVIIEIDSKKYTLLLNSNHNLLLDKTDV
ncbi:MAG: hypothetical protein J0G32_04930 [Alphaproteobacteria bacterium]|nr:hypothetical protein [Alphaproteobacteria bacterium]OJV15794.1 MAG: hypothetical protein BGO27_07765 [Alphaproteobacteria bacterium 33-17]